MSLKPYPDYADSGVDWLGKLPVAWPVVPAKAVFGERKSRSNAEDTHLTPSQTYGVLPQAEYMEISGNRVVLNLSGADNMRHVEAGDYVSHLRSFQGGLEYSSLRGKVSAAYTVLSPRGSVDSIYFKYLFKSARYVQALQTTTDQLRDGQSIRYEQFALLPLPLPSVDEQREIARFLDGETAEIDAFIGDQEELIALLAERRTATISHAVNKGLDPSAPTKDSGVVWIGDIPASWEMTRVKNIGSIRYGLGEPPAYVDGGVPLVRATNVSRGAITSNGLVFVDPATIPAQRITWLRRGDIIVVRSGALTGDSAIIRDEYVGAIAGFDMVFRPAAAVNADFIQFCLLSAYVKSAQLDTARARAAQPHLNSDELGGVIICLPERPEQDLIVSFLNREITQIDAALADAREAILLSKERRAALISAAVTGKIDVRNHGGVE